MVKADLVRQYIVEYSEVAVKHGRHFSKRELAKIIADKHPDLFKDTETVRLVIRKILQCAGVANKKKDEEFAKKYNFIPEPIAEMHDVKPFVVPVSIKKTLWMADLHGRFYDKKAFETAVNYGIKKGCDSVVLLGDICDFYGDSKFDKDPRISSIWDDREWGQDILELLQDTFGYVVAKEGNHDVRRELHIARLAQRKPEFMDIASFEDYMFFDGCKVNFVKDYNYIQYGKLTGIHGHEIYGSGGVMVARNRLNKSFASIISAHSHISQFFPMKDIRGQIHGSWSLGCVCNLKPRYNPQNQWMHGCAVSEKEKDGTFEVDNKVISNGKIY